MRRFLLLIFCSFSFSALACLNEYRTLLDGSVEFKDVHMNVPYAREWTKKELDEKLHQLDTMYRRSGDDRMLSDYGVYLVYSGFYAEAKKIFQDIEQRKPGWYSSAANLGTTYELLGDNDSARYWIAKSLEINPGAHDSSEWIHLLILNAKIAAKNDANYFKTHRILNIDFGNELKPVCPPGISAASLRDQLLFQLNERINFAPAPDPVMAQLLFELGNLCAIVDDVKTASANYALAKQYGYTSELMDQRKERFDSMQSRAEAQDVSYNALKGYGPFLLGLGAFLVVLFSLGLFLFIRARRRSKI